MYGGVDINPYNGPLRVKRVTLTTSFVELTTVIKDLTSSISVGRVSVLIRNASASSEDVYLADSAAHGAAGKYYTIAAGKSLSLPIGDDVNIYVAGSLATAVVEVIVLGALASA